jgi:hypothetical protein
MVTLLEDKTFLRGVWLSNSSRRARLPTTTLNTYEAIFAKLDLFIPIARPN